MSKKDKLKKNSKKKAAKGQNGSSPSIGAENGKEDKLKIKIYVQEIAKYHIELVKLQEWIKNQGLKVVVILKGVMPLVKEG